MKLLFWISLMLIGYAYLGYPAYLWIQTRLKERPVDRRPIFPSVSILIAARNEEANLRAKIHNLGLTNYPKELLQIVIVSDGSTDKTSEILFEHSSVVIPVILEQSNGKAYALNAAVRHATGEVLVFQDARQVVEPDAISELVSCLADPTVGVVSGELLLQPADDVASEGVGFYWKIEKAVRKLESASGSVVGVTGAIYAIRRDLYSDIPIGTILDDVFVPMRAARAGKRVVFQASAIARDRIFSQKGKEFARKVRTLRGNYQLLRLEPWLLSFNNPLLFRFVSHKMLRLAVPLFLMLMLVASVMANGAFYRTAFVLQTIFYAAAALGMVRPSSKTFKPVAIAYMFVLLNAAAALAFYRFVAGEKEAWV